MSKGDVRFVPIEKRNGKIRSRSTYGIDPSCSQG